MNSIASDEITATKIVISVLCVLFVGVAFSVKRRREDEDESCTPPYASGAVPLLGHALQYKKDPPGFLNRQTCGVFKINLAGRTMVVIGSDTTAMRQVAKMPESIASARQAVADIGFEYTLGNTNVYKGTDWHKRILRDEVLNPTKFESQFLPRLCGCLENALNHEVMQYPKHDGIYHIPDLFVLVRRCILRASLDCFISPKLLNQVPEKGATLLNALMDFQNNVEDATAKAAVLPKFISLPLVLKPVARTRTRLTQQLAALLDPIIKNGDGGELGPWLQVFRNDKVSSIEAAELILGLMFAAHKNPAIGASQTWLFLHTEVKKDELDLAKLESARLVEAFGSHSNKQNLIEALLQAKTLRRGVLETMRLTAHAIGAIRLVQEPFELETESGTSYQINAGDTLAISHICTHYDAMVWGNDTEEYNLDRSEWSTSQNDNTATLACPVDSYKLTTFSNGVHKCPGERVAMAMMELTVALLFVHNCKISSSRIPSVSFERATLAQREGPVPVCVKV